mmetsp:Transcript_12172/g.33505  ORF Transcript_12172/g.33505 Transcript_12172/m.33505 type:complete len:213 (-) Transcript_12172:20-658(-)
MDIIDECNSIIVQIESPTHEEDAAVPEETSQVVRTLFQGTVLIQPCPKDHPCLRDSKQKYPEGEPVFLFTLKNMVDSKVSMVPMGMINFVTRKVIGGMWINLLKIAEDIREGKRSQHMEAIMVKAELYDWVKNRIEVMNDKAVAEASRNSEEDETKDDDDVNDAAGAADADADTTKGAGMDTEQGAMGEVTAEEPGTMDEAKEGTAKDDQQQ